MSWERTEYQESAPCACGKGKLTRVVYQEYDDYNRIQSNSTDGIIECYDCEKKYHLEHLKKQLFQYSWRGDGISDTTYLVENGYSLQYKTTPEELQLTGVKEKVVACYTKNELLEVIDEMKAVKFSTKLQLPSSRKIVELYSKSYKKKSLKAIIEFLKNCIETYDAFQWNPDTVKEYYAKEKRLAEDGQKKFDEAIEHSIKVEWERSE